tara:strand:+ start:208 stop:390 length:183 start_codon:yes stop_codon:yes gene_type:complete
MRKEIKNIMSESLRNTRKEILDRYSVRLTGFEHLDDGTGDYARSVSDEETTEIENNSEKT